MMTYSFKPLVGVAAPALLTLTLLALPLGVRAQEASATDAYYSTAPGAYVSLMLGRSHTRDSDVSDGTTTLDGEVDSGLFAGAAVGYRFHPNWRVEGELSHRNGDVDSIGGVSVDGDYDATALMVNGYFDLPVKAKLRPYVGAGLGTARVETGDFSVGGLTISGDDHDTVFAWQAMAGAAYEITPHWQAALEYRYFSTQDPEFSGIEAEYDNHTVGVKVGYAF